MPPPATAAWPARFCETAGRFSQRPHAGEKRGRREDRKNRERLKIATGRLKLRTRFRGIGLANSLAVLHLDPLAPRPPRLPHQGLGPRQLAASIALHVSVVAVAALIVSRSAPGIESRRAGPTTDQQVQHVVFLAPESPRIGGGGGGGGNRQPGPIRRAQGVGSDAMTLRVRTAPSPTAPVTAVPAPAVEDAPPPSIVLEAKSLAAGLFVQTGLPTGGAMSDTSTGPGSGGGVGTGSGTGVGSGRGPGLGPGSGGGTGGGVYRPGGAVSAPRLIKNVPPKYTTEAITNRTQGTVVLEVIVASDGRTSQIRVVRSLDRGGLDDEAVAAVAQWQFEPGRLAGAPVDVLVTVMVDFWLR